MGSRATALAAAVACWLAAGCNGTDGHAGSLIDRAMLRRVGLEDRWQADLRLADGERLRELHLLGDALYALTTDNRLMAVYARNGLPRWTYTVAEPGRTVYRPVIADGVFVKEEVSGIKRLLAADPLEGIEPFDAVMINTQTHVAVLRRDNGQEVRRVEFDFAATTAGATDGKNFYVGAASGLFYAIDLQSAIRLWSLYTAETVTAPLICAVEHVFVPAHDRRFHAAAAADRPDKVWTRQVGGPITAPCHVDPRGCFVPCEDGRVYAFRVFDGSDIWAEPFVTDGVLRRGVQVGDNTVFQRAEEDRLYAIDLASGRQRWTAPDGLDVLAVMDGTVYLLDRHGNLLLIDEILGRTRSKLPLTGPEVFVRNTTRPRIWAGSRDGRLVCLQPLTR
jgi:hypothetical protein